MPRVLIPLPSRDFDPTEAAVSWNVLRRLGHHVAFATPDARPAVADDIMVTGEGLDPWSQVPGLSRIKLVGALLRADPAGRAAYDEMIADTAYRCPLRWDDVRVEGFDGLLLPGGHRARGMREYLESEILQRLVVAFFAADKPVAAICHGVVLAARSIDPATGRSVLHGRRTTALTWSLEKAGWSIARFTRFWDPSYYRTYTENAGETAGYRSVQSEVTRALVSPRHFLDVAADDPEHRRKTSGMSRDCFDDPSAAFVVRDGSYVSARWPGDTHTFARTFADVLDEHARRRA
ncbi:MAG TPA: type 1 glutamine amidotransferase domain-containing protein [Candidatus Binatia bacterium]|jgi:putative intracellular protease/amidase